MPHGAPQSWLGTVSANDVAKDKCLFGQKAVVRKRPLSAKRPLRKTKAVARKRPPQPQRKRPIPERQARGYFEGFQRTPATTGKRPSSRKSGRCQNWVPRAGCCKTAFVARASSQSSAFVARAEPSGSSRERTARAASGIEPTARASERLAFMVGKRVPVARFNAFRPEGEILKRCVRVMPTQPAAGIGAPSSSLIHSLGGARQSHGGSAGMYVHCVSTDAGAAADVALQWKESAQVPGAHDVLIKYARTPAFPGVGEFYVLVFRDRFCAQVAELWHVVVHSRLRADVNCVAGQSAGVELVVRGDRAPRVVRAYAQAAGGDVSQTCSFDPPGNFRLVPNAHNKFAIHYRSSQAGAQRVHVHLVDVDSKELVGAWLLTAVSAAPQITKTYDVELPVGAASTKRIPYRNPWDRARAFSLVSSDEAVCKPRDGGDRLQIPPNGTEYLRLFFPAMRRGLHQVFLFVNDEHDQSEDVFLLRLIVA
ncbi:hypothetical protein M885DRAFT_296349 [Pelagophyceae sp. CCMP2097]|nr:hypothetical protein M885DRAFT_296349 [Pelagophyceae sp. CCMP2097]